MKPLRILTLSCVLALSPFAPAAHGQDTASLQAPTFLKVGEWYVALHTGEGFRPLHFKVLELAGGAWIKVEHNDETMWLNTNAALLIKPGTKN